MAALNRWMHRVGQAPQTRLIVLAAVAALALGGVATPPGTTPAGIDFAKSRKPDDRQLDAVIQKLFGDYQNKRFIRENQLKNS